jgi:hypothetical protein
MASACGPPGTLIRQSTGAVSPAARSSSASATRITPSQPAPPASAALATGTMPWP